MRSSRTRLRCWMVGRVMVWERVAAMVIVLDDTDDRGTGRGSQLSVGGGQVEVLHIVWGLMGVDQ